MQGFPLNWTQKLSKKPISQQIEQQAYFTWFSTEMNPKIEQKNLFLQGFPQKWTQIFLQGFLGGPSGTKLGSF